MDKKSFITIFIIYVTLDVMKDVEISDIWILNKFIKLIVCFTVFFIFAYIWNLITKEKF
ncbi:hypothetical protein SAMN05444673_3996 [Bacillus sp. OV166]|jgi:hypothetical protein|nr:hypothetical protein SAMN05444673_3996 [Bacillus sp. OV166]